MTLRPVVRTSLSQGVFEQLREQIVSGALEPGATLPAERTLSLVLGVNRSAVREALKRLEQARLVAIQQGGATRVLDFARTAGMDLLSELLVGPGGALSAKVARGVMEMRTALAPDIARRCAARGGSVTAARLDPLLQRMKAAQGDLPALQQLGIALWEVVVEGADNVAYQLAFNTMRAAYARIWSVLEQPLAAELRDLPAYEALVEAIRRGDEGAAFEAGRRIVEQGERSVVSLLAALDRAAS
ncbi:MAG: GntR family transcriptional regulator [Myxococcales bacterium]